MSSRRSWRRGVGGGLLLAGVAALAGCPGGPAKKEPEVRYEVRKLTPEEKKAKAERMKGNRHTQAQLLQDVERLRTRSGGRGR